MVEIDDGGGEAGDTDQLTRLPPEVVEKLSAELRATILEGGQADPVYTELFKLLLRRRANRPVEAHRMNAPRLTNWS